MTPARAAVLVAAGAFLACVAPAQASERTRVATPAEVRAFCDAMRLSEERQSLDQALDLQSCLPAAMTVRPVGDGATIGGEVIVNFPGHRMRETCSASLRGGRIDPETIDCR